jgi:hypothetical protein
MKKYHIFFIAIFILTGCSRQPINNIGQKINDAGHKEWPIPEEVMGPADNIVENIQKNEDTLSESGKPIYFIQTIAQEPSGNKTKKGIIQEFPLVSGLTYDLVGTHYKNEGDNIPDKYRVKLGDKTIFEHEMCYGAEGPIHLFLLAEDYMKVAITFSEACQYSTDNKVTAVSNIFYDGETINEKFEVDESKHLFSYKNKIGFIGKKNDAWYIFFNDKEIPYSFDQISDIGCCAAPYYFNVYENGALVFMAKKQNNNYIVEIDLNKYL